MKYIMPGVGELELNTIIFDLNGTLAVHGKVPQEAFEQIQKLKDIGFTCVLFSGDQRGNAQKLAQELGIEFISTRDTDAKRQAAQKYPKEHTVAIGNGRIDIGVFENAKVRIGTLQAEGIHTAILPYIDILVPSIIDALDLLLDPDSLAATMRM